MQLVRGIHHLPQGAMGGVATIGNFDGVHLGHQAVIEYVITQAKSMGKPSVLITFEPQPQEYFLGKSAPARLTRFREKWQRLAELGLDYLVVLRFDADLAALPALDFIQKILLDGLACQHLIVGDDFRFGHKRQGDFALLTQVGNEQGMQVESLASVCFADARVSSTNIRGALEVGDLALAKTLLGRDFSLCGRVAHGDKRGRQIGFPTANLFLRREVTPIRGVYAVTVDGINDEPIYGVANVGTRPTVDGTRSLLEVHLFNFSEQIYGRQVQVNFMKKLRDEKKYPDFSLLKAQIFKDAEQAKTYFHC